MELNMRTELLTPSEKGVIHSYSDSKRKLGDYSLLLVARKH